MSGELGLQNSFRSRVAVPLANYRGNDATGGRDISLVEFMQTRAVNEEGKPVGLKNTAGNPITMEDLFCDIGVDPQAISLDHLITMGDDMRYLAPEMVRTFILAGFDTDSSYTDLVAGSENVSSLDVTTPWIKYNNTTPQKIGEAETFPYADIEWDRKSVRLSKRATSIGMSDELMLSVKLPVLQHFLRKVGVSLNAIMYRDAALCLQNGDQVDGSESAAAVGVGTTSSIKFEDFMRLWIRCRQIGTRWDNIITNEATANELYKLDEFSKPQGAGTVVTNITSRNRIIPSNLAHFISAAMDDDQYLLFDKAASILYLSFRGLLVETERIVMRQIQGTAVSLIGGFTSLDRWGRVIMDSDLAFDSHGFPAWMTPLV